MDDIILLAWKDLDKITNENSSKVSNETLLDKKCCPHVNYMYNPSDQSNVCLECGELLETEHETCEWNSHKKDDGSFQKWVA